LPALSAQSDIQDLIASSRADLVSAQIWSLDALVNDVSAGSPSELAEVSPELGAMPAFDWILFGDSVGTGWSDGITRAKSEPDSAAVIVLKMSDADQAAAALAIVPARFDGLTSIRTSAPYRDLLTFKSAQVGVTESLVAFEFGTPIIGRIGQMGLAQDLRFVYPG